MKLPSSIVTVSAKAASELSHRRGRYAITEKALTILHVNSMSMASKKANVLIKRDMGTIQNMPIT